MGFFKRLGDNLNQRSVFNKPTNSEKFNRYAKEVKSSKDKNYKRQLYLMQQSQNASEAERKAEAFYNPKKPNYADRLFKGYITQRKSQLIYAREIRRPIIGSGMKKIGGGRGRPKGSYDNRYAKYGGVYGYRKILSAQLQQQRLQNFRANAVTPQQEQIIRQIEARQNSERINPENQTIPSTNGIVRMRSLHQEAEDAANLVP